MSKSKKQQSPVMATLGVLLLFAGADFHFATIYSTSNVAQHFFLFVSIFISIGIIFLAFALMENLCLSLSLRVKNERARDFLFALMASAVFLGFMLEALRRIDFFHWIHSPRAPEGKVYWRVFQLHLGISILIFTRALLQCLRDKGAFYSFASVWLLPLKDMLFFVPKDLQSRAVGFALLAITTTLIFLNYAFDLPFLGRATWRVHFMLGMDLLILGYTIPSFLKTKTESLWPPRKRIVTAVFLVAAFSLWHKVLPRFYLNEIEDRQISQVALAFCKNLPPKTEKVNLPDKEAFDQTFGPQDVFSLIKDMPELDRNDRPNVLIIILDAMRFDFCQPMGGKEAKTPSINRMFESGIVFENNYVTGNSTELSVPAILSGDYFEWRNLLSSELRNLGYDYHDVRFACHRKPRHKGKPWSRLLMEVGGDEMISEAQHILEAHSKDGAEDKKPWAMFMHFTDTHHPYNRLENSAAGTNLVANSKEQYIKGLENFDLQLGAFLNYLDNHEHLTNTITILTADHGEEFSDERNFKFHSMNLYDQLVKIPVAVLLPNGAKGRVSKLTSSIDFIPSLIRHLNPEASFVKVKPYDLNRKVFFYSLYNQSFGCVCQSMKYIHRQGMGPAQLYDMANDPEEQINLIGQKTGKIDLEDLDLWLGIYNDKNDILDRSTFFRPEMLK